MIGVLLLAVTFFTLGVVSTLAFQAYHNLDRITKKDNKCRECGGCGWSVVYQAACETCDGDGVIHER